MQGVMTKRPKRRRQPPVTWPEKTSESPPRDERWEIFDADLLKPGPLDPRFVQILEEMEKKGQRG